jgi:endoglucanase
MKALPSLFSTLLIALLVAACGGGSGGGTTPAADASSPTTPPTSPTSPTPPTNPPPTNSPAPGALSFSASNYNVQQTAGAVTVTVSRTGGSSGAINVSYATSNGTAVAGTDYSAASGALSWADAEQGNKTFSVPIGATPFSGSKTLAVTLSAPTGGTTLGTPSAATVNIVGSAVSAATAIRVQGNQLVNASGQVVQLRGVDVAGFGLASVQAWAWVNGSYDNWGLQQPTWSVMPTWGINTVRIPLNEASWLALTTHDPVANTSGGADGHQSVTAGNTRKADPGGNYRQQVMQAVASATALGFYVILDLHENGPNVSMQCAQMAASSSNTFTCPATTDTKVPMTPFVPNYTQNPLPDVDYSLTFWTSVAATFKSYPNVIFDLFNEPFISPWFTPPEGQWTAWLKGTTVPFYYTGGTPSSIYENWQSVGMQALVDVVRSTGATNVVMCGGLGYAGDMQGWLANMPVDPLHQLTAAWHAYPASSTAGDPNAKLPGWGVAEYTYVEAIAQQVPVIIGETGDHSADGTVGAPFASVLLPWADAHGVSYLGWTWNTYGAADNDLIKSFDGTPTDGFGKYFHDHLVCRAAGNSNCP